MVRRTVRAGRRHSGCCLPSSMRKRAWLWGLVVVMAASTGCAVDLEEEEEETALSESELKGGGSLEVVQ